MSRTHLEADDEVAGERRGERAGQRDRQPEQDCGETAE